MLDYNGKARTPEYYRTADKASQIAREHGYEAERDLNNKRRGEVLRRKQRENDRVNDKYERLYAEGELIKQNEAREKSANNINQAQERGKKRTEAEKKRIANDKLVSQEYKDEFASNTRKNQYPSGTVLTWDNNPNVKYWEDVTETFDNSPNVKTFDNSSSGKPEKSYPLENKVKGAVNSAADTISNAGKTAINAITTAAGSAYDAGKNFLKKIFG